MNDQVAVIDDKVSAAGGWLIERRHIFAELKLRLIDWMDANGQWWTQSFRPQGCQYVGRSKIEVERGEDGRFKDYLITRYYLLIFKL